MDYLLFTAEAGILASTLVTLVLQHPIVVCLFIIFAANVNTPEAAAAWTQYYPVLQKTAWIPLGSHWLGVELWDVARYACEDSLEFIGSLTPFLTNKLLWPSGPLSYVRSTPYVISDIVQIITGFLLFLLCWTEGRLFQRSKKLSAVYALEILQVSLHLL